MRVERMVIYCTTFIEFGAEAALVPTREHARAIDSAQRCSYDPILLIFYLVWHYQNKVPGCSY